MKNDNIYKVPKPPTWVNLINEGAVLLNKIGLLSFCLDVEELLKSAQKETGLIDFGDNQFLTPLKTWLNCFEDSKNLTYIGLFLLRITALECLKRRLFMERQFQKCKEIIRVPIKQPVIIVGFPRTGTTLLQNLLLLHKGSRWIRRWELETPFPECSIWGTHKDVRKFLFYKKIKRIKKFFPYIDLAHSLDNPAECWELFLSTCVCPNFFNFLDVTKYRNWSNSISGDVDIWRYVYNYYKRQLQLLIWHQGGSHFVLKSPDHILNLPALINTFPDARIVHIHRHMKDVVPSYCSMIYYLYTFSISNPNPEKFGMQMIAKLSMWKEKCLSFRKKNDSRNFLDIYYKDLIKNPIKVVKQIYYTFKMELPNDMELKLNKFLKEKHWINRPRRMYSLGQFGLKTEDIEGEFGDYLKYFKVR